jgi:hypothetical protein
MSSAEIAPPPLSAAHRAISAPPVSTAAPSLTDRSTSSSSTLATPAMQRSHTEAHGDRWSRNREHDRDRSREDRRDRDRRGPPGHRDNRGWDRGAPRSSADRRTGDRWGDSRREPNRYSSRGRDHDRRYEDYDAHNREWSDPRAPAAHTHTPVTPGPSMPTVSSSISSAGVLHPTNAIPNNAAIPVIPQPSILEQQHPIIPVKLDDAEYRAPQAWKEALRLERVIRVTANARIKLDINELEVDARLSTAHRRLVMSRAAYAALESESVVLADNTVAPAEPATMIEDDSDEGAVVE